MVGLAKAQKMLPIEDYRKMRKLTLYEMRNYLSTIYYIKTAERKIHEQEVMIEGGEKWELKRQSEVQIESLSRKKRQLNDKS